MAVARRQDTAHTLDEEEQTESLRVIVMEDGREVVRYLSRENIPDRSTLPRNIQDALALAGAWSDLNWDDMETELDRIRHSNPPTPPIDLDL
jgi:hypothetical protein